MSDEAKAIEELAKTTGKGIDAASEACRFIAKYIGGSIAEAAGIFEDKLKYIRWERQVRMMMKATGFLEEMGLSAPNRDVPMKIAIPIMQAAGMEEDDLLQDKWAALLANAANSSFTGEVRRSYISILEELNSLDVHLLDIIYSIPFEQAQHNGILTFDLPNSARVRDENDNDKDTALPPEAVVISLSNLVRLGCLRPAGTLGGGESYASVNPTVAGRAFIKACRI